MRDFLLKTALFIFAIISFFVFVCLLPATPRASKSFLFAENQKDSLLKYEKTPRIIFIGGSNVACGLNCQIIKDSLHFNPINTSITQELGLKYMLDNTIQYVKKNDVIVLIPEYLHYCYMDSDYGSIDLLHMILDVNKSKIKLLNFKQMKNCFPYIGNFIISRLNPMEYLYPETDSVYTVDSFNAYGDHCSHWYMQQRYFVPYKSIYLDYPIREEVIKDMEVFKDAVQQKGAVLFISYPPFQDSSFQNNTNTINKIDKALRKSELTILGTPQRYRMPDSLCFDSPYHLIKQGVDKRTILFIEDLKAAGIIKSN